MMDGIDIVSKPFCVIITKAPRQNNDNENFGVYIDGATSYPMAVTNERLHCNCFGFP